MECYAFTRSYSIRATGPLCHWHTWQWSGAGRGGRVVHICLFFLFFFVTVNIQSHLYAIMEGERGWQDRFNYIHFLLHFATIRHNFNGQFLTHFATFVSLCKFSHQSAWPKNGATGWKVGSVAFGAMALKNCRQAENVVPCPALLNWYCSSHVLRRLTFRNLSDQG